MTKYSKIISSGSYLPSKVYTNHDIQTNKMNINVHRQLLDLAAWIKIDFEATANLEEKLLSGYGEKIILHFEEYAHGARSPVIVFEGLSETSPLKIFLEQRWKQIDTVLYFQSRERTPAPPWNKYFGLILQAPLKDFLVLLMLLHSIHFRQILPLKLYQFQC